MTSIPPRPSEEEHLVELCGMPPDSIPEVDTPWKPRGNAVGLIFQAGQEAADSSYPDTQNQRHREKVASRHSNAQQTLGPFDGEQCADQSSHDRLSAEHQPQLRPMGDEPGRILESGQQVTADESAKDRRADNPPPRARINHVTTASLTPVKVVTA